MTFDRLPSPAILGLFAKHPVPGQVKTRLAAVFGPEQAAKACEAFISDTVARFRQAADRRYLCYSPPTDAARDFFCNLAADAYALWPQPDGDLGMRLRRFFFGERFRQGDERVVVIGTDSPTLPREHVELAFELLREADVVLGPATDGGYYLVGQRGRGWPIFEGIDWSSPRVLEQTVACVERAGGRLALLPPWYDVDTPEDWQMLRGHMRALQLSGWHDAPATAALLGLDTVSPPESI